MNSPTLVTRRVVFEGRVQGVGFRHTTAAVARHFLIGGYVRNLPDGTVELVVQAAPDVIDEFVGRIRRAFAGNITGQREEELSNSEIYTGFGVRR